MIDREFQTWYNYERPHSPVNHLPPGDQTMPIVGNRDSEKEVVCTTRLSGLLKSYCVGLREGVACLNRRIQADLIKCDQVSP